MNLPNKLTLLRIALIPFFMVVLYWGFPGSNLVALVIFAAASITDLLDGQIARKHNLVTDFGKFADPLADKMLVTRSAAKPTKNTAAAHIRITSASFLTALFNISGNIRVAAGRFPFKKAFYYPQYQLFKANAQQYDHCRPGKQICHIQMNLGKIKLFSNRELRSADDLGSHAGLPAHAKCQFETTV